MRETLAKTGLVGIARVVLRTRQHVAAVLVHGKLLVLNILRYAEELQPAQSALDVEADEAEEQPARRGSKRRAAAPPTRAGRLPAPSPAELKMATMLVEEMRDKWEPERYKDEYAHDVMELVEKKVREGKTHEVVIAQASREAKPRQEVVDLMPLLVKSLGQRRGPARASRGKAATASRREPRHRRRA